MLALEIDNPEIELIFKTKFQSNKNNFINFIQDSLKNLEVVNNDEFKFKKLEPKQNSYRMITKEDLKNEIEELDDSYLDLVFRLLQKFPHQKKSKPNLLTNSRPTNQTRKHHDRLPQNYHA